MIYIASDNIISPLGFSTSVNFEALKQMKSGVQRLEKTHLSNTPIYAALIDDKKIDTTFQKINTTELYTKLEKLIILSVQDALNKNSKLDITSPKTLIILSTTKGNIDLLNGSSTSTIDQKRRFLWEIGNVIGKHFKNPNTPLIVSNACISGVLALIIGKRLLEQNTFETIIACGVDTLTPFVVSGFQSFKAVSNEIAKPYDKARDGISLGEAAATIILTNKKRNLIPNSQPVTIKGGASSNDANHISGPSRTGDGLCLAINKTLKESNIQPEAIDYISGHGTATLFNDEMEALAVNDANLQNVPMNSLKSYFGHTLGAAGVVESVIAIQSMRENTLIGTYNFDNLGVSKPINIISRTTPATITTCLKTAVGFGGCNAAIVFQKEIN